jgi:hypothetical protein
MVWMVCSTCALGAASREEYAFWRKSKESAGVIEWQQSAVRFNISHKYNLWRTRKNQLLAIA